MPKLLCIDDQPINIQILYQIFSADHDMYMATSGAAALTLCDATPPDLILLDWYMPVMNGIDFLPKLRALPEGGKPIVVFCTTENDMSHIQQAMAAGANEYVMKPFDEEIITNKLTQVGILE